MKVLYHHRTMGRGAEGVHVASMVKAFETIGHLVHVVSPPSVDPLRDAGSDVYKLGTHGVSVVRRFSDFLKICARRAPQFAFEILEILYNVYSATALTSQVRRFRPDLFYERYAFFAVSGGLVAKAAKIPYVLEVNEISGAEGFFRGKSREQSFVWLAKRFEKRVVENADLVLVVSSYLKRRIEEKGVPSERILVLPNGVDAAKFSPEVSGQGVRAQYGIARDDLLLGFVGWFAAWDRLDDLLRVYSNLRNRQAKVRLMLVGDGSVRGELVRTAQSLGILKDTVFAGGVERQRIQEYAAAIDIGVLADSNEYGSPIALLEFMASGKPVVAPGLDPVRDVVEDGNTGLIFPRGDFTRMESALVRLIKGKELRMTLGANARSEVLKKHTWGRKAELVLKTLEQVMERRRTSFRGKTCVA